MQPSNQPKTDQPPPPSSDPTASVGSTTGAAAPETAGGGRKPGSVGGKLRGAVHVVHGAGESLRGSVLGAFGSAFGEGGTEATGITSKGKEEYHKGLETLKPGHHARMEARQKAGAGPEPVGAQQPEVVQKEAEPSPGVQPPAPPPRRDEAEAKVKEPELPPYEPKKGPEEGAATTGLREDQPAPGSAATAQAQGQERYQESARKEGQRVDDVGGPAAGLQPPVESGTVGTGGTGGGTETS